MGVRACGQQGQRRSRMPEFLYYVLSATHTKEQLLYTLVVVTSVDKIMCVDVCHRFRCCPHANLLIAAAASPSSAAAILRAASCCITPSLVNRVTLGVFL